MESHKNHVPKQQSVSGILDVHDASRQFLALKWGVPRHTWKQDERV